MNEQALFIAALPLDPASRRSYLDRECAGNDTLRQRVERLLAAYDQAGSFLRSHIPGEGISGDGPTNLYASDTQSQGPVGETAEYVETNDALGTVVAGKYKLVEIIGEGGMGTVYMAQQTEPVKRYVAIKLIKAGMDSKAVLARFEAERQALAMMDHPNIAKILDGGLHENRPYFVMELVKGTPITEFCDARKLSPRERLELFVPVCNAIQHAHQKGIIHRDIKPSNVLIALYDDKPVPKVIDFGVAKATGMALTEKTINTGFGGIVGTPQYMSPEQATFNNLDIDTRSDVYSLGVLLYELLAGSPPFSRQELEKQGLMEILRVVREEEPPRPSAKLSTAAARASISANRNIEPAKLSALMKGEIDWIVMRSLEKDRSRRYESANSFAADVQRYLSGEQVQAVPPSLGYRMRKAYRRNRVAVRVAGAFMLLMLVAVAVSSWLAVQAKRAEQVAEARRIESDWNAMLAEYNKDLYADSLDGHVEALMKADSYAKELKIDLDLVELSRDSKVGLLRLVQTTNSFTKGGWYDIKPGIRAGGSRLAELLKAGEDYYRITGKDVLVNPESSRSQLGTPEGMKLVALQQFITAAILSAGQDHALLLPAITIEGKGIVSHDLNPNSNLLLIQCSDGTCQLWNIRTAKMIAILRQGNEHVAACGISPDGKTIATFDNSDRVRLWDGRSGELRKSFLSASEVVKESEALSTTRHIQITDDRILLKRIVRVRTSKADSNKFIVDKSKSFVELWDAKTAIFIRRLDQPEHDVESFQVLSTNQWIVALEGETTGLVFSAEHGRETARLSHDANQKVLAIGGVSQTGRHIVTSTSLGNRKLQYHVWDIKTSKKETGDGYQGEVQLLSDDLLASKTRGDLGEEYWQLVRIGQAEHPETVTVTGRNIVRVGNVIYIGSGRLFDINSMRRLQAPAGRAFHPSIEQFAPDGRYFVAETITGWGSLGWEIVDTKTEKILNLLKVTIRDSGFNYSNSFGHIKGFGTIIVEKVDSQTLKLRLIPTTDFLAISHELLLLWVQVAVRGELGQEGEFKNWNEATWEKKRQELAAIPPPYPDFPFPGYVATDKLHWLRAEYHAASEKDKPALVDELLRRSELFGDKNEAIRWRRERAKYVHELAPSPRQVDKPGLQENNPPPRAP